jgi:hypothetical protein
MARTIELKDGKTQRKFTIRKMGAYQAESWIIRASLACGRGGDITKLFSGDKTAIVETLLHVRYEDAKPLLDELLGCVYLVNGEELTQLNEKTAAVIESPMTLMRLRIESVKENFGFFTDGKDFGSLTGLASGPSANA